MATAVMAGVQLPVDGSSDSPDWQLADPPGWVSAGWGTGTGCGSGIPPAPSACASGAVATASVNTPAVSSFVTRVKWIGIVALSDLLPD
ncbi:hypothetical protein Y900_010135 [Mycolicibacterium aromaticivorans JS19b1 = JCM 16368]|uniref:Uncharacterized protein n=1 Tax=Mycolicibacterium aromaticivorans JS19b1 = JCM 16368 TaxID=1440774 RepID=A0A064CKK1_9MYCO|nr:hypothetical protein Y900_010135 [Mycolicibacterium aromaticivorans JS19b1 = JCM 16368]